MAPGRLNPNPIISAYPSAPGDDPRYKRALAVMYKSGNHEKAYALLTAAAADGDALSTYALATWHLFGIYVRKNLKEGNRLLRIAADKNVAAACSDLGVSYYNGWGVRRSYNSAAKFYLRAFLLGDVDAAQWIMQLFYWEGTEVSPRTVGREFGRFQTARGM